MFVERDNCTNLDVRFVEQPGPVREDLVDLVQILKFAGYRAQPLEPRLASAIVQELCLL